MRIQEEPKQEYGSFKLNLTGFQNLSGSLLKFLEVIKSSFLSVTYFFLVFVGGCVGG
jgi:hypothetical protein